jgi:hypothetical protein
MKIKFDIKIKWNLITRDEIKKNQLKKNKINKINRMKTTLDMKYRR